MFRNQIKELCKELNSVKGLECNLYEEDEEYFVDLHINKIRSYNILKNDFEAFTEIKEELTNRLNYELKN